METYMRINGKEALQGSLEWLSIRKNYVGASEIACLFDVSPYQTRYELYLSKKGLVERSNNTSMEKGKELESSILQNLEQDTSLFFMPEVHVYDKGYLLASLDGIDSTGKIIAEIKLCNQSVFNLAKKGIVMEHYRLQVMGQLLASGADMAFFHCYNPSYGYATVKVYRDEVLMEEIYNRCKEFMEKLESETIPELTSKDIPIESSFYDLEDLYFNAVEKRKAAEKEEESIKDRLIAMAPANDYKGMRYEITKKSSISYSYKNICELNNIDITPYGVEKESWGIKQLK